jgi:hypothetical protein
MSYIPIVNDILLLQVVTLDNGPPNSQLGLMNMHLLVTATGGGQSVTQFQIATYYDQTLGLGGVIKTWLNNQASYRGMLVQKVWPLPKPMFEFSDAAAGAGTSGAQQLPRQTAGLLYYQTALAGRAFRGRNYVPFGGTALQHATSDQPSAAALVILNAIATSLGATYTINPGGSTITVTPVIYHPKGYGKPPANLHTTTGITFSAARTQWATQKRRGDYGRQNTAPF